MHAYNPNTWGSRQKDCPEFEASLNDYAVNLKQAWQVIKTFFKKKRKKALQKTHIHLAIFGKSLFLSDPGFSNMCKATNTEASAP